MLDALAWYPESSSKHQLQQCLDQKQNPVFAYDVGNNGCKFFFTSGYKHFVSVHYKNMRDKHVYEVLQEHKPTKVFIDLDLSIDDNESTEQRTMIQNNFEQELTKIIECFRDELLRINNNHTNAVYVLRTDHTNKLSVHLIWDVYFDDIYHVKNFVLFCVSKYKLLYVDKHVYTKNRSFRLLYSSKKKKDTTPHPLFLINNHNHKEYIDKDVFNTMIQNPYHMDENGQVISLDLRPLLFGAITSTITPNSNQHNNTSRTTNNTTLTTQNFYPMNQEYVKKVQEFVSTYLNGSVLSNKETDHYYMFIVANIPCAWAKRVHKSNHTYMYIEKARGTYMASFKCADPECPAISYSYMCLKGLFI